MGYQPALDGVRAMSVIAVILYHAGFTWMHGGFFGVEVFFVVSGFLITSLLIEERDRDHHVDLLKFWQRRWRRLLPALFTMLVAVGVWAVFWGSAEQHAQLRRDYPWGIFYLANWGQIFSKVAYFSGTPTLFRHLWSLAVEEQWYLLWPLVFMVIARRAVDDKRRGRTLVAVSVAIMVATALVHLSSPSTDTTNFLYLSTFTRCTGLLLGAALAFLYRPWTVTRPTQGQAARTLDRVAILSVVVLVFAFVVGHVANGSTYLFLLPMVTIASAGLVATVVHPWATDARRVFGSRPMVEIGKRSYGLYLWTWPISRMCNAYQGSFTRFALAMAIAIPVSEVCYRFVETPIRKGVLGRWLLSRDRADWRLITNCAAVSVLALLASMLVYYRSSPTRIDLAVDTGRTVVFDPGAASATTLRVEPTVPSKGVSTGADSTTSTAKSTASTSTSTTFLPADLPRRMAIVGDSMAHALFVNLPSGIDRYFTVADGSVEGCSVYDGGKAVSTRPYTRSFVGCKGWDTKWAASATKVKAQVTLVVLGAWDVFDVQQDAQTLTFGTAANDQRFTAGLQKGINSLSAAGSKVALLEVACMRPKDVKGAGVPALPERGEDLRVAHLNELMKKVAEANKATTTFVKGPPQYCNDPAIAESLAYRWDGVHAYKPGANLTMQAITTQLFAIPVS
jgi:peptidoglycan/LPS O-acetylase OafA/YrhL